VHRHSAQAPGGFGDRVSQGEECDCDCPLCGKEGNFSGEHFWARGYAVSTVGLDLQQLRQYIREQETADGNSGQFEPLTKARFSATPRLVVDRL
jgi:hypothetical protein